MLKEMEKNDIYKFKLEEESTMTDGNYGVVKVCESLVPSNDNIISDFKKYNYNA